MILRGFKTCFAMQDTVLILHALGKARARRHANAYYQSVPHAPNQNAIQVPRTLSSTMQETVLILQVFGQARARTHAHAYIAP